MSKSIGNVIILQDILQKVPGQVRLFIKQSLSSASRLDPLLVEQTTKTFDKFGRALGDLPEEEMEERSPNR